MKTRPLLGISLCLTLLVVVPVLFFLTRGIMSSSQFGLIVVAVLSLFLWTVVYVTLFDPLLRRGVGALLNVTIHWSGIGDSISWTHAEAHGCLAGFFIGLLGYLFLFLWIVPFVAAVGLVFWLRG